MYLSVCIGNYLQNNIYIHIRLFIMDRLCLCMNLKYHKAHMFYVCKFSGCTVAPIMFMEVKYYLSTDNDTTIFYCVAS